MGFGLRHRGQVGLFFGLWLIPMGWCVLRSYRMPRPLGWTLVAGGIGYVLSPFVGYLAPAAETATLVLVLPATGAHPERHSRGTGAGLRAVVTPRAA